MRPPAEWVLRVSVTLFQLMVMSGWWPPFGQVGDGSEVEQSVAEVGTLGYRNDGVAVTGHRDRGELFADLGLGKQAHAYGIPFAGDIISRTAEADAAARGARAPRRDHDLLRRWMPLRYASETAEHLAVRRAARLFDLSHMGEIAVAWRRRRRPWTTRSSVTCPRCSPGGPGTR